jgi:hypothetical protein
MSHHMLCPNQLRDNDVRVNDIPLLYTPLAERNEYTDTISTNELVIPLSLDGVHFSFISRVPTDHELANPHLFPQVHLTADRIWEPHDRSFCDNESSIRSSLSFERYEPYNQRNISEIDLQMSEISPALNDDEFVRLQTLSAIVTSDYLVSSFEATRKGSPSPLDLAKRWFIGLHSAKRTLERTTQRGVRDFTMSQGTRRLRHSTYQLMYRHIRSSVYTDTMFASVKSLQGNKCAQIYTTWFQWIIAYPMASKADAHFTLDRLHREYGIFHTIIPDNAKELTAGEFRRKALKAGTHISPIEAYSHNQNLAERAICEFCRMFRKAMRQTHAPYVLWDFCIELMSKIRSHTALDILVLQGDTPHTFLTGDTSDIYHLCEFRWYDDLVRRPSR